jgi:hypothetical protein
MRGRWCGSTGLASEYVKCILNFLNSEALLQYLSTLFVIPAD